MECAGAGNLHCHTPPMLLTFDLFSALIDSRTGASAVLGAMAAARAWDVDGDRLYAVWDARNKASQRDESTWIPFAEHSRRALAGAYAELDLDGDADDDVVSLLQSVDSWPLWPDVAAGLPALSARYAVGVLSNVDDAIFARTAVAPLVADDAVLTSERLHAYKPAPEIYRRARQRAGGALVHVATSARDVRGAQDAGIELIRLRRPGHDIHPSDVHGVTEVTKIAQVSGALERKEAERASS